MNLAEFENHIINGQADIDLGDLVLRMIPYSDLNFFQRILPALKEFKNLFLGKVEELVFKEDENGEVSGSLKAIGPKRFIKCFVVLFETLAGRGLYLQEVTKTTN